MTSRERQGWWIAASLFLALFLLWGSGFNTAGLFIAPLIKQFGWARTQVSLLVAAMAFASGISSPIAGRLLERVEAGRDPGGLAAAGRRAHHREPRERIHADAGRVHDPGTRTWTLDLRSHRASDLELVWRAAWHRAGDSHGRAIARRDGNGAVGQLDHRTGRM